MGARPSSFKAGGGFLNNVDGKISDYEFTDVFPFGDKKAPAKGKGDFNPLYFVLSVEVDGKEKTDQTTMFAGSADDFEISKDGKTLTPVDPKFGFRKGNEFAYFIESLVNAGLPETDLPDDEEPINYETIIGRRVRFVQEADVKAMEKSAKTYKASKGLFNEQGQKRGKDGKYYNQTRLVAETVYAEDAKASSPKAGAKSAKGKDKGVDLNEIAKETLLAILADSDGKIAKAKLPVKIQTTLGSKHPQREELRQLIFSDAFLETEDGWTYDKKSKNQTIEVAEVDED